MLLQRELAQIHGHITKTLLKPHLLLNPLLRSLAKSDTPEKALEIYNHLLRHSSAPHDHFTYTYAIKASSLLPNHAIRKGREIHARVVKSGHGADIFIQNSLINLYTTSGDVDSARRVFSGVADPDVVSWTSIVSGLARNGCDREAISTFASMDVVPNEMTLVSLLSACSSSRALELGKAVHGYSLRSSVGDDNIILENAILDLYMSCGAPVAARQLFETMSRKDVVSWTTMVSGYARNGSSDEAIRVFHVMMQSGEVTPNEATIVSVLSACASIGALSLGKWVHSCMDESQIRMDGLVGNALINMYSKCGDMAMALMVFKVLPSKDLVSWCTIIGGMALNGRVKPALQLFSLMIHHGVRPDSVAFLAMLSACCHAGLIDLGFLFFEAMTEVYGIAPGKQHCACMVDMFGRAGLLEEAKAFVRDMPVELDGHVLGALLNACKIHGCDKDAFENAREHILEGKIIAGGGIYALISNVYMGASEWNSSISVREVMRLKRIKKAAGCSWIYDAQPVE